MLAISVGVVVSAVVLAGVDVVVLTRVVEVRGGYRRPSGLQRHCPLCEGRTKAVRRWPSGDSSAALDRAAVGFRVRPLTRFSLLSKEPAPIPYFIWRWVTWGHNHGLVGPPIRALNGFLLDFFSFPVSLSYRRFLTTEKFEQSDLKVKRWSLCMESFNVKSIAALRPVMQALLRKLFFFIHLSCCGSTFDDFA